MRRSREADRLVAAPHVINDREGDDRRDAVGEEKEPETVRFQPELPDTGLLFDEIEGVRGISDFGFWILD
jgi:hypothetical protein